MDFSAGGDGSGSGGRGGDPGDGREQAERWVEIAEKLLAARDLIGCKHFAERAVEADPLLPGVDKLLVVADILQLSPGVRPDQAAVSCVFRRLALLLGPATHT